jgi:myo-inositol-1(or 4)-monophosphatase
VWWYNSVMDRDLTAARDLAATLAAEAGALQLERRDTLRVGAPKEHANDLVSDVDIASERLIVDRIGEVWPDDAVQAEEGHGHPGTSGWTWLIDPLDGTRNYISRTGPWSVCVALYHDGAARMAVVHEPVAGETFSAIAGGGALLNGVPIPAAAAPALDRALIGVSFHPTRAAKGRVGTLLADLLPRVGDIRRVPAALNLVYVAAGRLDGGVALDTKLWDIAAGALIAREAGAVLGGAGADFSTELTIAAAPALWPALSERTRAALATA